MIGVVADDTTGANDIGIMFVNGGYTAKVVTFNEHAYTMENGASDVLILDTDSRLDSPEESYRKVFEATNQLMKMGCTTFFNKTCSVFRGNVGKELDAMMDATGEDFAVIILAFPKNGRTTRNAIHQVNGVLLEQTPFSRDPVHPMLQSNLVEILQRQTSRQVESISIDTVRNGAEELRQMIDRLKDRCIYCIIDGETQEDLRIIAEAVSDLKVIAGSSAIAEELPKFMGASQTDNPLHGLEIRDRCGVLVISGSLTPNTLQQTAYFIHIGKPVIILDSRRIFSSDREEEIMRVIREAQPLLESGFDVLVMADNSDKVVEQTKALGEQQGMDPLATSKLVSAALAEVAKRLVDNTGLRRLVVAGGDTSGTVSRKLGFTGNYVLKEIETGVPSGLSLGHEMLIVLKSGSYGKPEFLDKAVNHLKEF
ncbi:MULTISPECIES: four-carbon acid sugar kinase family protein [unclassified Paenibacillus]|uniref:four-carbon acid sugar kinase family protein n=1 Tax=unclassified Paenibacillus TaxID=185978 RepID=UPI00362624F8